MDTRIALSRRLLLLLVAGLAVVAVGCGGSSKRTSSSTPTTLPGAGGGTTVAIIPSGASWRFQPASLKVSTGAPVTWVNQSDVQHNVVFSDASVKSSDLFDKGKTFSTSFAQAGTFAYSCSIHPDMKGTVTVS